ncbi:hypothetical protein COO60DRAFT_401567 [Scenedesmus sp. NREL 46B-D3]|nr:hypothetical protein COO60DRAFT_401567 [Scenedesmus sp. NREL 46B-D3]
MQVHGLQARGLRAVPQQPSKVCDDADCFDHQYWVRDDGKGGQLIKAKCGSDVCLQLVDKETNSPVVLQDVRLKLYVVNGQQLASSGLGDPPAGLYLSDDGHPLFAAAGVVPEEDKGVAIEVTQDDRLGPAGRIPELQFLDKNSKFKVGGRTFKSFKLMARAVRCGAAGGMEATLAQVESESFKVTTKKGYDGCRKADYLCAHDPITDKTFASLGETTISNLKSNFDGVETVEDLMTLVQACRAAPDMEARLRETLNMARDAEKWRNLIRMLTEKVVWDDSMARIFVLPTASRPLGLLYRANKAQVDFDSPTGIILSLPAATGQLRVARLTDRLQLPAARHVEALRCLAPATGATCGTPAGRCLLTRPCGRMQQPHTSWRRLRRRWAQANPRRWWTCTWQHCSRRSWQPSTAQPALRGCAHSRRLAVALSPRRHCLQEPHEEGEGLACSYLCSRAWLRLQETTRWAFLQADPGQQHGVQAAAQQRSQGSACLQMGTQQQQQLLLPAVLGR